MQLALSQNAASFGLDIKGCLTAAAEMAPSSVDHLYGSLFYKSVKRQTGTASVPVCRASFGILKNSDYSILIALR